MTVLLFLAAGKVVRVPIRRGSVLVAVLAGQLLSGALAGGAQAPSVKVFHPDGPMPSYEVATIKPAEPEAQVPSSTLRMYISFAYGIPVPMMTMDGSDFISMRVIGGPAWIDKDRYAFNSKPSDELRVAMQKMPSEERWQQDEMMRQSLLAERFHLKMHIETREMPVIELVPAKNGIKIKAVDVEPGATGKMAPTRYSLRAGDGVNILDGRSVTMEQFASAIRGMSPEIAGKPVIDMSGFTGHFDLVAFRFAGMTPARSTTDQDIPSLGAELDEKLGLKLVAAKAPVEVVVIDSIDRPTEN